MRAKTLTRHLTTGPELRIDIIEGPDGYTISKERIGGVWTGNGANGPDFEGIVSEWEKMLPLERTSEWAVRTLAENVGEWSDERIADHVKFCTKFANSDKLAPEHTAQFAAKLRILQREENRRWEVAA